MTDSISLRYKSKMYARGMPRAAVKAAVSQKMQYIMKHTDITLLDLHLASGISMQTLQKLVHGEVVPNSKTVWKLCTTLRCSPKWLLTYLQLDQLENLASTEGSPSFEHVRMEMKEASDEIRRKELAAYQVRKSAAKLQATHLETAQEAASRAALEARVPLQAIRDRDRDASVTANVTAPHNPLHGFPPSNGEKPKLTTLIINHEVKNRTGRPRTTNAQLMKRIDMGARIQTLLIHIDKKISFLCHIGITYEGARNIARGKTYPSAPTLYALANLFNLTTEQLTGDAHINYSEWAHKWRTNNPQK